MNEYEEVMRRAMDCKQTCARIAKLARALAEAKSDLEERRICLVLQDAHKELYDKEYKLHAAISALPRWA